MKKLAWACLGIMTLSVIAGMFGTCSTANSELARTARVAVETSREAMNQNDAAYLWPGRLRLLAVALGVTIPIGAAAVLAALVLGRKPQELEVLALAQKRRPELASDSSRRIEADTGQEDSRKIPVADGRKLPSR